MASLKEHADRLASVKEQNLEAVKRIQQGMWIDRDLSPLARAVMGLTGSRSVLRAYEELAATIADCQEEPLVVPTLETETGAYKSAVCGILAGKLSVRQSGGGPAMARSEAHFSVEVFNVWEDNPRSQPRLSGNSKHIEIGCITAPGKPDEDGVPALYAVDPIDQLLIGWKSVTEVRERLPRVPALAIAAFKHSRVTD